MSYIYTKNVSDESLMPGKITIHHINWDIDLQDAYERLDNMSKKNAANALGMPYHSYLRISSPYELINDLFNNYPVAFNNFMGIPNTVILPDDIVDRWHKEKNDEIITNYLSDTYDFCINEYDIFDYSEEYKKTLDTIGMEFAGFDNGHSDYMIVGIDKDKFTDFLINAVLAESYSADYRDGIGHLQFEEKNGYTIATFDTCEKYPRLNDMIEKAFPDAIVYGFGDWDYNYIEAPEGAFDVTLDRCFADDGNLRIDLKVIDKISGAENGVGDLICFDYDDIEYVDENNEIHEKEPEDETYQYYMSLLDANDRLKVVQALDECRAFHRDVDFDKAWNIDEPDSEEQTEPDR